jgi:hypothetical protein
MTRLTQQLFHVAPGERWSIARFALLGLLIQAGLAFGTSAADSLFLVRVGAEKLSHIYILTPVLMLFYIPAYSALLARWGLDRVFDCTLALLVAGGLTLWLLCAHFANGEPIALCYAVKLYAGLWYIGLYTLFWNFIDGYFGLTDAKRLFALFAAGSATGGIIGGSLVAPISAHFGVGALFLAWAVCAALTWPVVVITRRHTRKLESDEPEAAAGAPALAEAAAAARRIAGSRYAIVLTAVLFLTLFNATICEYQYMGIFAAGLDEASLAALFGHLTAMVNVVNLALTLLVLNRLVARIGVRNVALIQPVAYAVVFAWLLLDGSYPAAIAGFLAFHGLMTAIDFNNVNLLFTGLPAAGRKQIRTVIEGLCEPLATASAGFFLLFAASRLSPEQLSISGIVVSLACLALVFVLRHDYLNAIAANLRRAWLDFSRPAAPLLSRATPADLALAEARTLLPDPDLAAFALRILWLNDPARLTRALTPFLHSASPATRRAAFPLIDEILAQPASESSQEIRRWLDTRPPASEPELSAQLGRNGLLPADAATILTESGQPTARAAGALVLWRSWRVGDSHSALRQIEALLASSDEASLLAGLRALGQLREPRYAYQLRDHLRSLNPIVRGEALAALATLADSNSRVLLPELLATFPGGSATERQLALEAFAHIGDSGYLAALLAGAGTFTPGERRQTERIIAGLGARAVPTLIAVAQNSAYTVTARSVALRALGKLALPQLQILAGPLIELTTVNAYVVLNDSLVLDAGAAEPGQAVLRRVYRDYPRLVLSIVLETLAVAGRLPSFESVLAGLESSEAKDRGYAIESVEQACGREIFALLLPLIDGRPVEAQVAFGRARGLIPEITASSVLEKALRSDFPLEAAAAAQARHALDPDGAAEPLLAKLRALPRPLLRETVLTLFARRAGRGSRATALTPIEAVHALLGLAPFSGALFTHLEFMAPHLQLITPATGTLLCQRGEPLPGIWLVRAGAIITDGSHSFRSGTIAGIGAIHGQPVAAVPFTAGPGLEALFLPTAIIHRCIETFPELGLSLLANAPAA